MFYLNVSILIRPILLDRTWRSRITGSHSNRTSDSNQIVDSTTVQPEQLYKPHPPSHTPRKNSLSTPSGNLQELQASALQVYSSSSKRYPSGPKVSSTKRKFIGRTHTAPPDSSKTTPFPLRAISTSIGSRSPSPNSSINGICGQANYVGTAFPSISKIAQVDTDLWPKTVPLLNSGETTNGSTTFSTEPDSISSSANYNSMSPTIEMQRLNNEDPSASGVDVNITSEARSSRRLPCCFGSSRNNGRPRSGTSVPPANRIVIVTGMHRGFLDNSITTAKYNPLSFLPKFIFEQFRRYANLFFLFIALMQQIPNVSPTGRFTTAVPLAVIMMVSAIKEMFEDVKRHRADNLVNTTEAEVVNKASGTIMKTKWKDIAVGDLVLMRQDQFFPCDLVLISSNEPSGKSRILSFLYLIIQMLYFPFRIVLH